MLTKALPPLDILRQLLSYDPETGLLHWLPRPIHFFDGHCPARSMGVWNAKYAGTEALGRLTAAGYKAGKVLGGSYQAHRIAWALHTGTEPQFIDHINGVKSDNRIANLRSVSWAENARNRAIPANNTSGVIGVHWCNRNKWWVAQIGYNGKQRQVGVFASKSAAIEARAKAELQRGFHENHGRPRI